MQFTFGLASATEVAYYTYMYAQVKYPSILRSFDGLVILSNYCDNFLVDTQFLSSGFAIAATMNPSNEKLVNPTSGQWWVSSWVWLVEFNSTLSEKFLSLYLAKLNGLQTSFKFVIRQKIVTYSVPWACKLSCYWVMPQKSVKGETGRRLMRQLSALLMPHLELQLIILMTWICFHIRKVTRYTCRN